MSPSTASAGATAVQKRPQGPQPSGGTTLQRQGADSKSTPAGEARNAPEGGPSKRRAPAPKSAMEHSDTKVTTLPPAGREEQLERWGITPGRLGDHLFNGERRHGQQAEDAYTGELDEEDEREVEARGTLRDGGWHVVEPPKGPVRGGGTTSHRGVLHPEEFVDPEALRPAVEAELGFTFEEVRSVYRQGPLNDEQRGLRGRIDARLLALSNAGGHMLTLGRLIGWAIEESNGAGGDNCRTMERALERARKEQS